MTQINPYGYQPPMPNQAPQQAGYPQPVVYRPGAAPVPGAYGTPDVYRPGMPPMAPGQPMRPGQPMAMPQQQYEYVSKKDVGIGIMAAIAGFFLAGMLGMTGPMGAIVFGAGALALSAIGRAVSSASDKKKQQQHTLPINQMPNAPQYPQPQMQPQYNPNQQQQQTIMQQNQYRR
ncbi:MAG: hypothetical protein ACO1RX_11215 [Candidatus Sericytochromatia bacterium]